MKSILLPAAIAIFVLGSGLSYAQELPEVGSFSIEGKLGLDYYYHTLGDNWSVKRAGYKGINYNYSYGASAFPSLAYDHNVFGETLYLDAAFHPIEDLTATFGFEFINDYADRFWLPVNLEHRLKLDDKKFSWNTGEIKYDYDFMSFRYFRGIGHYNWKYEGDLFDLFPEQFDTRNYLRVSGRPVPEGYEFMAKGKAGQLQLIYGPEAIWDYTDGWYANYALPLGKFNSHFIYRDHVIPYGDPGERLRSFEVSTDYDLGRDQQFEMGLLYQPFRLNRDYIYVEDTAPGTGYLGSRFLRKTGTTSQKDAFGGSAKLSLNPHSVFSNMTFGYTYAGLVAGNKQQVDAQVSRKVSRTLMGSIEYMYRKPLLGPVPLVYEGTAGNLGPAIFEPRGPESPFWVGWANRAGGWDNRETSQISFIFTFDPTPDTWFYLYEPNTGEEWNLNPEEDAPVSFSARYTLAKYFSGTDRLIYWDENGHQIWEPPTVSGAWPTKDYIGSFSIISKIFVPNWRFIADLGVGESLATGSFPYTTSLHNGKPDTGYLTTGVTANTGRYTMRLRFSQNDWGPEQWHRQFGQTFDSLYQASISRVFSNWLNAGIGYIGARADSSFLAVNELGNYDEFHAFMTLSFGPIRTYWGAEKPKELAGPAADTTAPEVSLVVSSTAFSPNGDGVDDTVTFFPWASDFSGIGSWDISITDGNDRVVKTFAGSGTPPESIVWDGKDDIYDKVVPEGTYFAKFEATDAAGNSAVTPTTEIAVVIPPKVIVKEVVKEVTKEIKVKETRRGLLVSLTSRVLFDFGKSKLKPAADKALQETIKVIEAYPENEIAVEGHTDSIGSKEFNQRLSEQRAKSVADYLIRNGIAAERIKTAGYGEEKPVADNSTVQGREANRRVEVIILRQ
jgi:outer membrane protein OmpA-like peptidoglycan-associated protein